MVKTTILKTKSWKQCEKKSYLP